MLRGLSSLATRPNRNFRIRGSMAGSSLLSSLWASGVELNRPGHSGASLFRWERSFCGQREFPVARRLITPAKRSLNAWPTWKQCTWQSGAWSVFSSKRYWWSSSLKSATGAKCTSGSTCHSWAVHSCNLTSYLCSLRTSPPPASPGSRNHKNRAPTSARTSPPSPSASAAEATRTAAP